MGILGRLFKNRSVIKNEQKRIEELKVEEELISTRLANTQKFLKPLMKIDQGVLPENKLAELKYRIANAGKYAKPFNLLGVETSRDRYHYSDYDHDPGPNVYIADVTAKELEEIRENLKQKKEDAIDEILQLASDLFELRKSIIESKQRVATLQGKTDILPTFESVSLATLYFQQDKTIGTPPSIEKTECIQRLRSDYISAFMILETIRSNKWHEDGSLVGINFENASLHELDFSNANLERANFNKANLQRANLAGAYLQATRFTFVDLQGAVLTGANLVGVDMAGTNLQGARLEQANIQETDLIKVNLQGTDLTNANLLGALSLEAASFDEATILPDGKKWIRDTDMSRYTDPEHPNFWQPDWVDKQD